MKKVLTLFLFIYSLNLEATGAVATGHPLATKAGLEILEKGGNAFDAAVAIASTLNVVEPAMSGLGGYGSTLIYDASKKEIRFLNSSGKFPVKANSDLMRAPTERYLENRKGPKSICTPGNLNAWEEMHSKYGKLPWNSLFESAISHAKTGFPISPWIAKMIEASFNQFSNYSKSFYGKDGAPLKEGDILIQSDLAKIYELIASKGALPFYHGEIALKIDEQMRELDSFLTIEDMQADSAQWWDPIKLNYRGYEVYTMGVPGNGFSSLFILGVMGNFSHKKSDHNSSEYLHLLVETLKKASEVRLNSPGHIEEKDNIINNILKADTFASSANSIDKSAASSFNPHPEQEGHNTTHFVVIDRWGNIVSSTQTLGTGFGSKVMIEGTGIWMNNSMAFSTFEPKGNPMDVLPGRHKLSSNSPIIIIKDGLPWAALGTPGGHTIPQNIAQIIINLIDFEMNMQDAIDAPKVAFSAESGVVLTETGISDSAMVSLENLGHVIDNDNIAHYVGLNGKIGNAMGVKLIQNTFDIGIDRRKDAWSTTHIK